MLGLFLSAKSLLLQGVFITDAYDVLDCIYVKPHDIFHVLCIRVSALLI